MHDVKTGVHNIYVKLQYLTPEAAAITSSLIAMTYVRFAVAASFSVYGHICGDQITQ